MTLDFPAHISLLQQLLDHRRDIVDRIEGTLLNVRGKETSKSRNRQHFDRLLHACFFEVPGLPRVLSRLRGQLAASHLADGFEPMPQDRYSQELDPLQLIVRAYLYWDDHRWPGRSGRLAYAETIYAAFMLRQLEYASLRIWDDGHDAAPPHLQEIQRLLDRLNSAAGAVAFVRDARWLIHTAQSPLTRHLLPYFRIAEHIAGSFTGPERLGIHKAGAKLAGGHLRSQLHYRVWDTGRPMSDPELVAFMRSSNSMDAALLVHDLVPLLAAYDTACRQEDAAARLDLADAILQGISADPDLLVARLDLLAPSTTIEHLHVGEGDGRVTRRTPRGEAHGAHLTQYGALIGSLAGPLKEDASAFDPSEMAYSPLGITYGFCADILSHMAIGTLLSPSSREIGLEDVFASRGNLDEKVARTEAWQALPRREGEREHFDHSPEWARQMFGRTLDALAARAARAQLPNASSLPDARLYVVPASGSRDGAREDFAPSGVASAQHYCFTSNVERASSNGAIPWPRHQMLTDRSEGRYLASAEENGEWFGISKIILTEYTSQGKDAVVTDVPHAVVEVLRVTCPGLIVLSPGLSG
jgi:hypothetical protein